MNRRELLTYAGAAGAISLLPKTNIARAAASGPKRRLIMVYARGGWDPTLILDPKTQSAQVDVSTGTRKMFGSCSNSRVPAPVPVDIKRPSGN